MNKEQEQLDIMNEDPIGYEKTIKILKEESNLLLPDKEKFFQLIHKINAEKVTNEKLHPSIWQRSQYYFKTAVPVFLLVLIVSFIGIGNSITNTKKEENKEALFTSNTTNMSSMSVSIAPKTVQLEPTQAKIEDVVDTLKSMSEDEYNSMNDPKIDTNISNWSGETKNMIMTTYYENSF